MNNNILWEFNPKIIKDSDIEHNLEVLLKIENLNKLFVMQNNYDRINDCNPDLAEKLTVIDKLDVYDCLKAQEEELLIRVKCSLLLFPPLVERVLAKHLDDDNLFTYSDAYDLFINICIEVISKDIFIVIGDDKPLYPDKTLGLPDHVKSNTYLFDFDDQAFYYLDHFDDYYAYPKGLNIEPAIPCNLKCTMCTYQSPTYSQEWLSDKNAFFPLEDYKRVIDELATYPKPPNVELVGRGEPMLNKDIVEWIKYAADRKVKPFMVTNATLLTEEMSDKIIDAGIHAIYFSLDGATRETYNKSKSGCRI